MIEDDLPVEILMERVLAGSEILTLEEAVEEPWWLLG